ncbi:unnamed protein product [Parascedosporium putredinis]|uniref:Uncharacterized protein n=1 Tax=Parascedosporium putredinis TaxID=1442378 RepID=A0A9P1M989_9PEZI|nr:unnamed protein product [Parascedosporium putredinis]CAI7990343.1 unnamed protein product [Parascedosporium putredinis]
MASNLLLGRIAIVTGAASGLGRATALAFAKQGAAVVCADQKASQSHQPATHQLIINMGGRGIFAETDVSDSGSMEALVRKAVKEYGRLDM